MQLDPADPMAGYKTFSYDTSVQDIDDAMLLVKKSYGADRLLLGSDEIFASLTEMVSYIKTDRYLTEGEKHVILDVNAQKVFNFQPHWH